MLLLLFAGASDLSEPVITPPVAGSGIVTQFPATSGAWRFALEIAEPPGSTWYDISQFYVGDRYQRGADEYKGKYRASLATVQLQIDNVQAAALAVSADILAPWGQDTTDLFGANVRLGAGLLMRASMVREVASVVVEWLPIWTGRVESWGDASFARGQTRVHEVSVVDTIADLANVPVENPLTADTWPEYFEDHVLAAAAWPFGVDMYGDPDYSGVTGDDTAAVAITRMDVADVLGLVWRSLRSGRLVIHPAPWDTIHVERYDNPLLVVYPDGLKFSYTPDFTDIEYIADDDQQPFGISRSVAGILNSFVITYPGDLGPEVYADDDPVSTSRYGIRPYTATWIGFDPQLVDDLKASRAYAESQALPLRTTVDHEGFWTAMALVDHLDPVTVVHATSDDGLVVTGTGTVRNIVEERAVRADGELNWQSTIQIDLDSTETSEPLLPVEDLVFVSSESSGSAGPSSAEFTWTNPTQPSITPTEVQYRVLGHTLIWTPTSYPGVGADGQTVNWLAAGQYYTFQVRLVRRVDGVVTNFSVWRQVRFFTPNRIFPIPIPGTDPTDTDVIGEPPDDECDDFQIDLQENDGMTVPYEDGWTTVDTFTDSELTDNGDGTFSLTTPIPNSFFNDGSMYRFRSSCDGVDWIAGTSFDPPDDWTDPCTTPPALSDPPFDDPSLLVYVPKICAPDVIREAVSGHIATHGDALAAITTGLADPDEHALLALADPLWSATSGSLAYGYCPQIAGHFGDKSITIRANIVDNSSCVLGECAGLRLTASGSGGDWNVGAGVNTIDGVMTTISGDLAFGTYVITATYTQSTGTLALLVDGVEVDTQTLGAASNTIHAQPTWRVGAPPESWVTDFALFDSVIVPTVPVTGTQAAIVALGPKRYYTLEGSPPFDDLGSLNLDTTSATGTYTAGGAVGGDGRNYLLLGNTADIRGAFGVGGEFYRATNDQTIVMLLKPSSVSGNQYIIQQADGSFIRGQVLLEGDKLDYVGADSVAFLYYQSAASFVTAGAWHMYVHRSNVGSTVKEFYKDNTGQTAGNIIDAASASATSYFRIGNSYVGGIAHIATWDRMLSTGELTTIYNAAVADGWAI